MGEATMLNGGFFAHKKLDLDAPIYRCIKFKDLVDILKNRHLYFRNVLYWDDTWEIPSRFLVEQGDISTYAIRQANRACSDFFGTCWTDTVDSDALWRIYSGPDLEGVCIETTPRKLFKSIDFSFSADGFVDGFIAPIIYESLEKKPIEAILFGPGSQGYPRNMFPAFFKRKAFAHEREIRFLIHFPSQKGLYFVQNIAFLDGGRGVLLPLKDADFINRIVLDPRTSPEKVLEIKNELAEFSKKVEKSALYDVPAEIYKAIQTLPRDCIHHIAQGNPRWIGEDFLMPHQIEE